MTIWEFLDSRPGWGLIYLTVGCFTVSYVVSVIVTSVARRSSPPSPLQEKE